MGVDDALDFQNGVVDGKPSLLVGTAADVVEVEVVVVDDAAAAAAATEDETFLERGIGAVIESAKYGI